MPHASLVVQRFSDAYVRNFARFVLDALRRSIDPDAALFLPDEVDDAAYPDGLVFLIGEKFKPFERRPGCRYIYLNLSVISWLGNPFAISLDGHRVIRRKRQLLAQKLPQIDVLLDYYPAQTARLARELDLPVLGFDVAMAPRSPLRREHRQHDVCFVGGLNERRRTVLNPLSAKGVQLSPHEGAPIEDIAAASRLCLNIHAERSRHLETPRIAAALSVGTPVLTETSYGAGAFAGHGFIVDRPLGQLASTALSLLEDPDRLAALGADAAAWYGEVYYPGALASWESLCQRITEQTSRDQAGNAVPSRHHLRRA